MPQPHQRLCLPLGCTEGEHRPARSKTNFAANYGSYFILFYLFYLFKILFLKFIYSKTPMSPRAGAGGGSGGGATGCGAGSSGCLVQLTPQRRATLSREEQLGPAPTRENETPRESLPGPTAVLRGQV